MNEMLDIYSDYLIAQNQYASAVGLSDLLEGRISHDKITRFLNAKDLTSRVILLPFNGQIEHILCFSL